MQTKTYGDRNWLLAAKCRGRDAEDFFPDEQHVVAIRAALAICSACDVATECLDDYRAWARRSAYGRAAWLAPGVWGGTTLGMRRTEPL